MREVFATTAIMALVLLSMSASACSEHDQRAEVKPPETTQTMARSETKPGRALALLENQVGDMNPTKRAAKTDRLKKSTK